MNGPHDSLDDSRVEVAATAPNEIVARMWQEVLESEGIVAALKPTGPGHSFASSALMEHQILVLAQHTQRARAILSEFEEDDSSAP